MALTLPRTFQSILRRLQNNRTPGPEIDETSQEMVKVPDLDVATSCSLLLISSWLLVHRWSIVY